MQVLIVEDDTIMAESMGSMLAAIGYTNLSFATTYLEALNVLKTSKTDFALVDIRLGNNHDGILLASQIHSQFPIPFIFTSSLSDPETLAKAKETFPFGYLVKPFDANDLMVAMEIARHNFYCQRSTLKSLEADAFFVKMDCGMVKIEPAKILFINGEGNYIKLHFSDKKPLLVRSTLKEFLQKLPDKLFVQVHKSFIVNFMEVNTISGNSIVMQNTSIPISPMFRELFFQKLKIDINF